MIATANDFLLDAVRHVAEENGWLSLHDSGPAYGRVVIFAKKTYMVTVDFNHVGKIVKAVRANYGVPVAQTYLADKLPQPVGGTSTQSELVAVLRLFENGSGE